MGAVAGAGPAAGWRLAAGAVAGEPQRQHKVPALSPLGLCGGLVPTRAGLRTPRSATPGVHGPSIMDASIALLLECRHMFSAAKKAPETTPAEGRPHSQPPAASRCARHACRGRRCHPAPEGPPRTAGCGREAAAPQDVHHRHSSGGESRTPQRAKRGGAKRCAVAGRRQARPSTVAGEAQPRLCETMRVGGVDLEAMFPSTMLQSINLKTMQRSIQLFFTTTPAAPATATRCRRNSRRRPQPQHRSYGEVVRGVPAAGKPAPVDQGP